ncbi:hypothetical protein Ahy_A07g032947 isoform B [Arachis hypogaea]|uniref:Uncharacterized protein n=1 Tax=Arachis hypogaea TaxID=3818 RepID=A0A445C864_ARAHY|nr:hypothetical protein Ahy_A07g032947 isoform B [Arachis hypogaea]
MASDDSFLVLVHYRKTIKNKIRERIKFTGKDLLRIQNTITQKLRVNGTNRILISVVLDGAKYDSFVIYSEDLQVRIHEAKLGDVVSSSRRLNRIPQSV